MKNKGNIRRRRIYLALSLLWMAVIFYFSGQNAAESGHLSGVFSELLGLPDWLVRKGAHMAEYAVLGWLLSGFFHTFSWKKSWFFAWGAAVCYAALDEFHQMFSAGRSPSVWDVCIDAAGALIGVAAMYVTFLFRRERGG